MSEPTINPHGNNPAAPTTADGVSFTPGDTAAMASQALLFDVLGDTDSSRSMVDSVIEHFGIQGLTDCILLWSDTFLSFAGFTCDDPTHEHDLSALTASIHSIDGSDVSNVPPEVTWTTDFLLARAQGNHPECRRLLVEGLPEEGADIYRWVLTLLNVCSLNLKIHASRQAAEKILARVRSN